MIIYIFYISSSFSETSFCLLLLTFTTLKVEGREQENPKGTEFSFGFGNGLNGPIEFFGTSGGISNKHDEWTQDLDLPLVLEQASRMIQKMS